MPLRGNSLVPFELEHSLRTLALGVFLSLLCACGSDKGACYSSELSPSSGQIVHYCFDNTNEDGCRLKGSDFERFDAEKCCVASGGLTLLNPEDCAF